MDRLQKYKKITEIIDQKLARELNEASNKLCEKLLQADVDMYSMNKMIQTIKDSNNFFQNMFKKGFSKEEYEIRLKYKFGSETAYLDENDKLKKILKNKFKDEIDRRFEKLMEEDELIKKYIEVIFDRKEVIDKVLSSENNKRKEYNERYNDDDDER